MQPPETTIRLGAGETAVVGYGSLLSEPSISKTLKRAYTGPFLRCRVSGWRRSWDVSMPNQAFYFERRGQRIYPAGVLYLNVRRAADTLMNCALFVLSESELRAMNDREWIYQCVRVNDVLRGVRVTGGDAIMYVARPEHLAAPASSPQQAAVRASYLRILERTLADVEPSFRAEFDATTDPVPAHLVVDDLLDPSRPNPWAAAGHDYRPDLQLDVH